MAVDIRSYSEDEDLVAVRLCCADKLLEQDFQIAECTSRLARRRTGLLKLVIEVREVGHQEVRLLLPHHFYCGISNPSARLHRREWAPVPAQFERSTDYFAEPFVERRGPGIAVLYHASVMLVDRRRGKRPIHFLFLPAPRSTGRRLSGHLHPDRHFGF